MHHVYTVQVMNDEKEIVCACLYYTKCTCTIIYVCILYTTDCLLIKA